MSTINHLLNMQIGYLALAPSQRNFKASGCKYKKISARSIQLTVTAQSHMTCSSAWKSINNNTVVFIGMASTTYINILPNIRCMLWEPRNGQEEHHVTYVTRLGGAVNGFAKSLNITELQGKNTQTTTLTTHTFYKRNAINGVRQNRVSLNRFAFVKCLYWSFELIEMT